MKPGDDGLQGSLLPDPKLISTVPNLPQKSTLIDYFIYANCYCPNAISKFI